MLAMLNNEDGYKSIIQSFSEAIICKSLDDKVITWNPAAEAIYGYRAEEAIGQDIGIIIPEEKRGEYGPLLEKVKKGECVKGYEAIRKRKDSREIHVLLTFFPIKDAHGKVVAISTLTRDITDEYFAEERYKKILEAAPDGVLIIDEAGKIQYVNKQLDAIFGYAEDELVGKTVEALIPETYHSAHASYRKNYFDSPRTRPMGSGRELLGLRKNKETFPVEISFSPLRTKTGTIAMATIRDVSDRKKIEKMKDAFISLVSHELRTPMTSINGSLDLLAEEIKSIENKDVTNLINIARR